MKKLFLVLVLCLCSLASWAQDENYDFYDNSTGQTLYYKIIDGGVEVTRPRSDFNNPWRDHTQPTGSLTIPSSVSYHGSTYSVTTIGECAFFTCHELSSVTIPNSVTTIGSAAFDACYELTSVIIGGSVTSIGSCAFQNCRGLTNVTIPNSVTGIGVNAFLGVDTIVYCGEAGGRPWGANHAFAVLQDGLYYQDCDMTIVSSCANGITTADIPNTVTTIAENAFAGCTTLTNVTIPNSVTTIGSVAFDGCSSLTGVTIPASVTSIGNEVFANCPSLATLVVASSNTHYDSRGNCNAIIESGSHKLIAGTKNTVIPNTVILIGVGAFSGCSGLTSITIPNSVDDIELDAFRGCSGLTSITIPNSVGVINAGVFSDCSSLTSITIPNSVGAINDDAFYGCSSLNKVLVPCSVSSIGDNAFNGIDTVYCGSSATGSPWGAGVVIPDYWEEGDPLVYNNCSKTMVIGCDTTATHVTIPETVTTIGEGVFDGCSSLTSVTIGNSVATIGEGVFRGCSSLTSVTISNSVATIGEGAFRGCSSLTSVTIGNSVTTIGASAFSGCSGLASVTIPNSVTTIGNGAFEGCSGLASVTIPNSVTTIGYRIFYGCTSLTSVTIGNGVITIEDEAFYGCSSLTSVTIGNSVATIGEYAFLSCSNLTSIIIPNSVTAIGTGAFVNCINVDTLYYNAKNLTTLGKDEYDPEYCGFRSLPLQTLVIGDSVETLPEGVFYGQDGLTTLTIPHSVTSIGNSAFEGCTNVTTLNYNAKNLTTTADWYNASSDYNTYGFRSMPLRTLLIGDSVETLPAGVFYGQDGLTTLTIPHSVTTIGENAFSGVDKIVYCGTAEGRPWGAHNIYGALQDSLFFQDCDMTIVNGFADGLTTADIPNTVTTIADNAFKNCSTLTSVIIPSSVTTIGGYAFSGCTGLTSVTFPSSMTYIPAGSFYNCSGLESITIPNSVTEIRREAFMGCSGLTSVSIGSSVTKINEQAFRGCSNVATLYYNAKRLNTTGSSSWISTTDTTVGFRPMHLRNVVIGDSVETLPDYVFPYQSRLVSITIPNSVRAIGGNAFRYDDNLTNVTLPNMITTINGSTFYGCSSLQSIVIPSSVTSIGSLAFDGCNSLKTVYNLSNLSITKGATSNGYVAWNAKRVLSKDNGFTDHGAGSNTLHQISTKYTVVDAEDDNVTSIPRSTIPANFIYYYNSAQKGWSWKANEIVLTDDTNRFVAPEEFTAATATYSREFTNSNRSTLYLPFTAAVPEGFEVYDFAGFDGHTLTFSNHEGDIAAYTPYLVGYNLSKDGNTTQCAITQNDALFPQTSTATPACTTTYNGMTFKGTVKRTCMTSNNYGYKDGFFVRSARGTANDHGSHAHVNPFRCYFAYTAHAGSSQPLPQTLNVEVGYGDPVGIDAAETPEQEYDNRYGKDVYDMLGRLVRKNADNLEGLPKGVYIWKGRKHVVS